MPLKLGRLPNDPAKPRLQLDVAAPAPQPPAQADWLAKVTTFPVYANDRIGDCTAAAVGHLEQAYSRYGRGRTTTVAESTVIQLYSAASGYDPRTGANDNGAVMQDVLNLWRTKGLRGKHQIAAFAQIPVRNQALAEAALAAFGGLYVGVDIYQEDEDAFGQGKAWDVRSEGSKYLGGHAIHIGAFDHSQAWWKAVTWGRVQGLSQRWWDTRVEEVWAPITVEWLSTSTGRDPLGLDKAALAAQFQQLTGKPAPW